MNVFVIKSAYIIILIIYYYYCLTVSGAILLLYSIRTVLHTWEIVLDRYDKIMIYFIIVEKSAGFFLAHQIQKEKKS